MVTRREFLQKSVLVTGGLAAGKLLVDPLAPVSLDAAQVDPNDPGLTSSEIKYASTDGAAIGGYITRPKGDVARPAVVVIHAWDGISDHTGTWREGLPKPVTWRWRLTFYRAREERVRLQVERRPSRRAESWTMTRSPKISPAESII